MDIKKVSVLEKLSNIQAHWTPGIIGELNGQHVKLAKLKGEFIWHSHEHEDELFLVLSGKLRIEFRDGSIDLEENELVVVPKGVEHRPIAEEEVAVLLFEPISTVNTGGEVSERTVNPKKL